MRISDCSSDVCSSDLGLLRLHHIQYAHHNKGNNNDEAPQYRPPPNANYSDHGDEPHGTVNEFFPHKPKLRKIKQEIKRERLMGVKSSRPFATRTTEETDYYIPHHIEIVRGSCRERV